MIVSNQHVRIESVLVNEAWRFSERGVEALSRLYRQLSPYRERSFGIDDVVKLSDGSECFLAVDLDHNGAIIGIARLVIEQESSGQYGILHDIVVDQACRGKGIGQALVNRAIERARHLRLRYIDLTSKPTRIEANQLYRKLGFVLVSAADLKNESDTNYYRLTLQSLQ